MDVREDLGGKPLNNQLNMFNEYGVDEKPTIKNDNENNCN